MCELAQQHIILAKPARQVSDSRSQEQKEGRSCPSCPTGFAISGKVAEQAGQGPQRQDCL